MKLSEYYLAFLLPFGVIFLLAFLDFSYAFVISICLYYVYRCFLDFYKLKTNGVVENKDIWKFIVPLWTFIYFKQLYFK